MDGVSFTSMEQFMMHQKASCFHDEMKAKEILETDDVAQIKELGRLVANYNDNLWGGIRQIVVYEGLIAKFSQDAKLKKQLLETKDAILAECAVKDCIWGIGRSMNDPKRFDITYWKGQNLLGYALIAVRYKIRQL